jgi:hypothetical protein
MLLDDHGVLTFSTCSKEEKVSKRENAEKTEREGHIARRKA